VPPATAKQGVDDSATHSSHRMTNKQPVPFPEGTGSYGVLNRAIVDLQYTVARIGFARAQSTNWLAWKPWVLLLELTHGQNTLSGKRGQSRRDSQAPTPGGARRCQCWSRRVKGRTSLTARASHTIEAHGTRPLIRAAYSEVVRKGTVSRAVTNRTGVEDC